MTGNLNTRARLDRALRNNLKIYSAWESFRNFRWFTLVVVIILPIYPSLSIIGTDYEARAGDYDETTIITAYEGDSGMEGSYINKSGLVSTDFDTITTVKKPLPSSPTSTGSTEKKQQRAKMYTVVSGDTLESIANKFNLSVETILWTNDISRDDTLKIGMEIRIPPVSGVYHKVAPGDTISEISRLYDVESDDIVSINNLKNAASIRVGMELMIPGAIKKSKTAKAPPPPPPQGPRTLTPVPTSTPNLKPVVVDSTTGLKSRYLVKYTGFSRGFVWGNCTWYVAQNKTVTWRGNANQWMKNAKAAGIKTGQTPVPGAIIQLSGPGYNRYYGHVGIVADVTDEHIILKDMNYRRLNEVTVRKIPKNDPAIDGFIYVD